MNELACLHISLPLNWNYYYCYSCYHVLLDTQGHIRFSTFNLDFFFFFASKFKSSTCTFCTGKIEKNNQLNKQKRAKALIIPLIRDNYSQAKIVFIISNVEICSFSLSFSAVCPFFSFTFVHVLTFLLKCHFKQLSTLQLMLSIDQFHFFFSQAWGY